MTTQSPLGTGEKPYDLAIVGGGILGLAHAYLAARSGLRVVVIERDGAACGASIRNFGFITVTGQKRGEFYGLALRSRAIWQDVVEQFRLQVVHSGLLMCVRHPESEAVLDAFMKTEMAQGCQLLSPMDVALPLAQDVSRVLHSRHEIRLESRDVIPALAAALAEQLKVDFRYFCTALDVKAGEIATSKGTIRATNIVVCQGDNLSGPLWDRLPNYAVSRCKLQMLRLEAPGYSLPGAVMSDLGLVRYLGYSELPPAEALRTRLKREQGEHLDAGVHLIVVQGADGTLVVGDSHVYGDTLDPFANDRFDALILDEFTRVLGPPPAVRDRWIGTYATSDKQLYFIDRPDERIRSVVVTCGAGASTAFSIAEKSLHSLGLDIHDTHTY